MRENASISQGLDKELHMQRTATGCWSTGSPVGLCRVCSVGPLAEPSMIAQSGIRHEAASPRERQRPRSATWAFLVELRGFEPLTFSLRTRRATNCATAPSAWETEAVRHPNSAGARIER